MSVDTNTSASSVLDVRFKVLDACAVPPAPVEGVECAWRVCSSQACVVQPGERAMVHTGVAMALPEGCAGMAICVHEVAVRLGLRSVNTPGLIDTGYRGEICFIAQNTGNAAVTIEAGAPLGQIVVTPVATCFIGSANGANDAIDANDANSVNGANKSDSAQQEKGAAMNNVQIDIKMLCDVEAPQYAHEGDNGLDLRAAESFELAPGERREVSLGFALRVPQGYMAQVQPRSGLALKVGLSIIDSPCVLPNPCEEVKAAFVNLDTTNTISIKRGERVAQLVVLPCVKTRAVIVDELDQTQRGSDGFGSSGTGSL